MVGYEEGWGTEQDQSYGEDGYPAHRYTEAGVHCGEFYLLPLPPHFPLYLTDTPARVAVQSLP